MDNHHPNNNKGFPILIIIAILSIALVSISTNEPWSTLPNEITVNNENITIFENVEYRPREIHLALLLISMVVLASYCVLLVLSLVLKPSFSSLLKVPIQIIPVFSFIVLLIELILSFTLVSKELVIVFGADNVTINITLSGGNNSFSETAGGIVPFILGFFFNTILVALNICINFKNKINNNNNNNDNHYNQPLLS